MIDDMKCIFIILIVIRTVLLDKVVIGFLKSFLTAIVLKIVSFFIMDKDPLGLVIDATDRPTFILCFLDLKHLLISMRHLFPSATHHSSEIDVVIALNVKSKISPSLHHFIVN